MKIANPLSQYSEGKIVKYLLLVVSTLGLLSVGSVTAHHSFFATYEVDKVTTIEGVVAGLQLVNPHAWIYVDTVNEAGETQRWKVELAGKLAAKGLDG
jgi:hypothetical protein